MPNGGARRARSSGPAGDGYVRVSHSSLSAGDGEPGRSGAGPVSNDVRRPAGALAVEPRSAVGRGRRALLGRDGVAPPLEAERLAAPLAARATPHQ